MSELTTLLVSEVTIICRVRTTCSVKSWTVWDGFSYVGMPMHMTIKKILTRHLFVMFGQSKLFLFCALLHIVKIAPLLSS